MFVNIVLIMGGGIGDVFVILFLLFVNIVCMYILHVICIYVDVDTRVEIDTWLCYVT